MLTVVIWQGQLRILGSIHSSANFQVFEANPNASKVEVTIDTASVDSNHAERDKHLRDEEFLDVEQFPEARFVSTSYRDLGDGKGELQGELTLHGVTRPLSIAVTMIGAGDDPWGGYRIGFEGRTSFALADFGIKRNLGPASKEVHLWLGVEGIRKDSCPAYGIRVLSSQGCPCRLCS